MFWASGSSANITLIDFQPRVYQNKTAFTWIDSRRYLDDLAESGDSGEKFDMVVNYLVGERLGLGRYGEDISIDADLDTMSQCKCMLKRDGLAVVAITMSKQVDDVYSEGYVVNNVGRVYGEARVKRLVRGWRVLREEQFNYGGIKILVLQKVL